MKSQPTCWTLCLLITVICGLVGGSSAQTNSLDAKTADRLARAHLTTRFERTKDLLAYLQKNDPTVHQQLLAAGKEMAPENELIAMTLARHHHPELADLLVDLKHENPKAFGSAIQSLLSDATKLKRTHAKVPNQYPHALEAWVARSKIRLLAARMRRNEKPDDEKQLRALIKTEDDAKRKMAEMQRERFRLSLQKAEKRLSQDQSQTIEQQLKQLRRAMANTGKTKASKKKNN